MTIFTRLLGTAYEGHDQDCNYYAVLDSDDTSDIAIVYQTGTGRINYVCDCCVHAMYNQAIPLLEEQGRQTDKVKAKENGNIERFLKEQKALDEQLEPYYIIKSRFERHQMNDNNIRSRPERIQREIADLEAKILALKAELEAKKQELPASHEAFRAHEQIMKEGLPEIPTSDVIRLETLAEGEDGQKPLFPEAT